jgi:cytochrome c553
VDSEIAMHLFALQASRRRVSILPRLASAPAGGPFAWGPARRWAIALAAVAMCGGGGVRAQTAEAPKTGGATFAVPAWSYPSPARRAMSGAAEAAPRPDSVTLLHVPNSTAGFTEAQVGNLFGVVDWHPDAHPAMPDVVAHGRRPSVIPCGSCHLTDGGGRPENAMLAGLPAAYIEQQIKDIRSGARKAALRGPYGPSDRMRAIADSATDAEIAEAAQYYSQLTPRVRTTIVETATIPTPVAEAGLYYPAAGGGTEPLGRRLIAMPSDPRRHDLRDPGVLYVTYVPRGSIARGKALATTWREDGAAPCTSCHGDELHGVGPIPPTAGRFPAYILRQLLAFKTGARATPASMPMNDVASKLSLDDMIAVAAYEGSLKP